MFTEIGTIIPIFGELGQKHRTRVLDQVVKASLFLLVLIFAARMV